MHHNDLDLTWNLSLTARSTLTNEVRRSIWSFWYLSRGNFCFRKGTAVNDSKNMAEVPHFPHLVLVEMSEMSAWPLGIERFIKVLSDGTWHEEAKQAVFEQTALNSILWVFQKIKFWLESGNTLLTECMFLISRRMFCPWGPIHLPLYWFDHQMTGIISYARFLRGYLCAYLCVSVLV